MGLLDSNGAGLCIRMMVLILACGRTGICTSERVETATGKHEPIYPADGQEKMHTSR